MNKTIQIDGQTYTVNVEKAITDGYLLPEKRYPTKIGQRVKIKGHGEFLLATTDAGKVNLINVERGSRWGNSKDVMFYFFITKEEFDKIIGSDYWDWELVE